MKYTTEETIKKDIEDNELEIIFDEDGNPLFAVKKTLTEAQ